VCDCDKRSSLFIKIVNYAQKSFERVALDAQKLPLQLFLSVQQKEKIFIEKMEFIQNLFQKSTKYFRD
jgi:hypothetical protein